MTMAKMIANRVMIVVNLSTFGIYASNLTSTIEDMLQNPKKYKKKIEEVKEEKVEENIEAVAIEAMDEDEEIMADMVEATISR